MLECACTGLRSFDRSCAIPYARYDTFSTLYTALCTTSVN